MPERRRIEAEAGMADVGGLFAGKDRQVLDTYRALTAAAAALGPFEEQAKTASIHLARRSAFAGVHPRKSTILLVLRTGGPIESGRIRKREKVSANRWHNELLVTSPADLDRELLGWLAEAYALSAP